MRVTIGLGLVGIVGIVACSSSDEGSGTAASIDNGSPTTPGQIGSTTDPTNPSGPPTGTSSSSGGPEAPPASAPEAPPGPIARGIGISELAVFQAVKVSVMKDKQMIKSAQRNAPVVANRPGILRVYVNPTSNWTPHAVTAELRLVSGETHFPVIRETKIISGASKEEDAKTTFNLELPAESLPSDVTFQVSLSTPDGDDPSSVSSTEGRFPQDGKPVELDAEIAGKVRIVVVPVKYDADGSGRMPLVAQPQLEMYKKTLMRMYPTSQIDITAHEPFSWDQQISNNGNGFANILRAITDLRQKDKVAKDVYYYGLLAPKVSMDQYCGGGCVTGLSAVVDNADSAAMRASVGIGFDAQVSANTMAHEVGHAHGRAHAPCGGPQGPDPRFPYQGGGIGVWGYDIFTKTLISPAKGKDIMGYCPNEWISDYNYDALFKRIQAISVEKDTHSAPKTAAHYHVATVGEKGELSWNGDLDLDDERDLQGGTIRQATFVAEGEAQRITRGARFIPFDHLPGGFLFVPKEETVNWKVVNVDGFANALTR